MKKILLASALVTTMGIGAFSVYADSSDGYEFNRGYGHMSSNNLNRGHSNVDREIFTEEERQEWFDQRQAERSEHRDERIQLALDEGWITEEEAAERRAELEERDRLHEKSDFAGSGFHHGGMRRENSQGRTRWCH